MARLTDLTNPIFTDLDAARTHFEAIRWPGGPYRPFCGVTGERVAPLGKRLTYQRPDRTQTEEISV